MKSVAARRIVRFRLILTEETEHEKGIEFIGCIAFGDAVSNLNLQRLSHFLAVVDSGSLGRASRVVKLSQPALTKSIRKLESELGFALFDRAGSLELTGLGREFLDRARHLVGQAGDLEREICLLRGGQIGTLKVACGATMAETHLAPALATLVQRHSGLRVEARVGDFRELPALLRSRQIDLGIGEYSAIELESDLKILPLPPQDVVFVCRPGHPLDRRPGRLVTLAEFFAYPLVATGLPDWAVRWLRQHHPEKAGSESLTVTCNHFPLLKTVIARTDAVSGMPEGVARPELEAGTLIRIRLESPPLVNQAGIIHLNDRTLSPAARLLMDVMLG